MILDRRQIDVIELALSVLTDVLIDSGYELEYHGEDKAFTLKRPVVLAQEISRTVAAFVVFKEVPTTKEVFDLLFALSNSKYPGITAKPEEVTYGIN